MNSSSLSRRHPPARSLLARWAGAERLRPILSTSVTTILGLMPPVLTDPMWTPLCLAIIFGLIGSTILSLLVIASLYLWLTSPASHRPPL